jgi:heterodisulfide reductase subunit C
MVGLDPDLAERIRRPVAGDPATPFDAAACLNCGVCTATCPMGIDLLPRRLFHLVSLGVERVLADEQEAIFTCLLCRACEVNCPAEVPITANVRALRHYINRTSFGL